MKKTGPRRPPPARTEEERLAVDAIARLEPTEPALLATGWPCPADEPGVEQLMRLRPPTHPVRFEMWLKYLDEHGVSVERRRSGGLVPRWANDLASLVSAYARGTDQPAVVRVVKRAVRAAARAPLFRAALAAEAQRLRGEPAASVLLLRWLRDRDWSDARPGAAAGAQDGGRGGA